MKSNEKSIMEICIKDAKKEKAKLRRKFLARIKAYGNNKALSRANTNLLAYLVQREL